MTPLSTPMVTLTTLIVVIAEALTGVPFFNTVGEKLA